MALPKKLQSARMTNATIGNTIDNNIGALEGDLCDILGFTIDTDITVSPFSLNNLGQITKALVAQRAAGPVGWRMRDTTSGKEVRIVVFGSNLQIDENTNTENSPTWTNRLTMNTSTGALTGTAATASAMGLCPQGDGDLTHFLNGQLAWTAPSGAVVPGCRVHSSAGQSIPNNTDTAINWDLEDFDTDTMHSNVTNNSRITCTTAGKYSVIGGLVFPSNATGYRRLMIAKNGIVAPGIAYGLRSELPVSGLVHTMQCTAVVDMIAGDYVQLAAKQTSGGALTTSVATPGVQFFSAYRAG